MKNGTLYAGRLKKAYNKHKQSVPEPVIPENDDPMRRLAIGILGADHHNAEVERAVNRLRERMIDWNEVRVSTAVEVQAGLDHKSIGKQDPCHNLILALQAIFDQENKISLDRLKSIGRREARQHLESLNGVNEFAVASVILWSLGGHAIPVNNRLLQALRDADVVNPSATRAEVQAFLERHIPATQAKEFCISMESFTPPKRAAKKPKATIKKKKKAVKKKKVAK